MVELLESLRDVPWHGEMEFAMCIVPVKMDADVMIASPIGADVIIILQCRL